MSNTHTTTNIQDDSTQIQIREVRTDVPLFPVETLERLHQFRPDLIDVVLKMTEGESLFRRTETKRINTLAFSQRLIGQLAAFSLGLSSITGGIWLASTGHDWAGVSIVGLGLTGLAVAFISGRNKSSNE